MHMFMRMKQCETTPARPITPAQNWIPGTPT